MYFKILALRRLNYQIEFTPNNLRHNDDEGTYFLQ